MIVPDWRIQVLHDESEKCGHSPSDIDFDTKNNKASFSCFVTVQSEETEYFTCTIQEVYKSTGEDHQLKSSKFLSWNLLVPSDIVPTETRHRIGIVRIVPASNGSYYLEIAQNSISHDDIASITSNYNQRIQQLVATLRGL